MIMLQDLSSIQRFPMCFTKLASEGAA